MLDTISGLPVHPLVVHLVVVLAPLTAILAIIYAVIPRTRRPLRWPIAVLALLAGPSAFLAGESGEKLAHRLGESEPLVHQHAEVGDLAKVVIAAGMLFTLLAVLFLIQPLKRVIVTEGRDGRPVGGDGTRDGRGASHAGRGGHDHRDDHRHDARDGLPGPRSEVAGAHALGTGAGTDADAHARGRHDAHGAGGESEAPRERRATTRDTVADKQGALGAFQRLERRGSALSTGPVAIVMSVLLVASSVATLWETFQAGHSGSKAVWTEDIQKSNGQ